MATLIDFGQTIRFKQDSRYGDWSKNQEGIIRAILALPPQNQNALYIVRLDNGSEVWATDKDIQPWNQLSLF